MTFPKRGLDKFLNEWSQQRLTRSIGREAGNCFITAKMRHAKFPVNWWADRIFPTLTTSLVVRYKDSPLISFLLPFNQYELLVFGRIVTPRPSAFLYTLCTEEKRESLDDLRLYVTSTATDYSRSVYALDIFIIPFTSLYLTTLMIVNPQHLI